MVILQFVGQYIKHPRKVGAVHPSSRKLAHQTVAFVDFESAECIVEYGLGTGVFTELLVQRKHGDTKLLVFESNRKFYEILQRRFGGMENVHIIHDSAEHVGRYVEQYGIGKVSHVVSGLPFTSLPREVSERILQETRNVLGMEGEFVTFQYSKLKQVYFNSFFSDIQINKVLQNIPPAYVFKCSR
ncbi:class I SAM-dependent methyltransferase [Planococcus lenghuensis]|uniref:SAM-dependent methyltransferase n=1 Tax=Planococcus lenghuensis TaxID=2213202 RepID=A0A1Q2KXI7_9BACL|nr:rRNA adenine N-6-methyltransferase family protein [Planococcus lenghuensis]AQQ52863.1 SAM-dependent methyltransferase [Planococcus lenghuensis]